MAEPIPMVAPHAGAWIETTSGLGNFKRDIVAPHAGAWIETVYTVGGRSFVTGRASCRRVD